MVCQFPSEAHYLFVVLGAYAVLMSIHYYIEKIVEKEGFYCAKSNAVSFVTLLTRIVFVAS